MITFLPIFTILYKIFGAIIKEWSPSTSQDKLSIDLYLCRRRVLAFEIKDIGPPLDF
jgi:hypothetical protein